MSKDLLVLILVTNAKKRLIFAMEQMRSSLIPVFLRFILSSLFKFTITDSMHVSRNHLQVWKAKLTFKYIAIVLLINVQKSPRGC